MRAAPQVACAIHTPSTRRIHTQRNTNPKKNAERAAIIAWLSKSDASPVTGQPLAHGALTPNLVVAALAAEVLGTAPPLAGAAGLLAGR